MLERDSFRKLDDWTMGTHMKEKILSCAVNNFGGRTVFPVWQMVQDDEEEENDDVSGECDAESVTRLTGNVRACYLSHLEKVVIKNYESCSDRDRTEWPFSRADLVKCASWMEYKALRSCMVVILYQRAMTRLVADVKKHTEQLKIYTKLKHFMSFDTGWSTKTTQTCEQLNFIDQGTQTDLEREIDLYAENHECGFETHSLYTGPEADDMNWQSQETDAQCARDETVQGVPIPVYVSGMSSTGFKSRSTQNIRVVKNIEPIPFSEINSTQNIPVLNGLELKSSENADVPSRDSNVIVEEPYEWSVIEEKPEIKSIAQENNCLSNGMFSLNKEDEEIQKMSLDERIAAVLGIENPESSEEAEEINSEKSAMDVDEEPSMWAKQKCENQAVLRDKILEKCVLNVRKRGQMRLKFLELFGSDSEDCFDIDEDVINYKDKLARWVVVSLMPYYREGRILSRPIFKFLARHIADKLLNTNCWPSESDVMQCVVEFFTCHNKIECEDDILS